MGILNFRICSVPGRKEETLKHIYKDRLKVSSSSSSSTTEFNNEDNEEEEEDDDERRENSLLDAFIFNCNAGNTTYIDTPKRIYDFSTKIPKHLFYAMKVN